MCNLSVLFQLFSHGVPQLPDPTISWLHPTPQLTTWHVVTGSTAMPWALFQSQQLGASAFLQTSQPLLGGGPLLTVPSHVSTIEQAPLGPTINIITILHDPRDTVTPLHVPLPPCLQFTCPSTAGITRWLQTHSMPPTNHPNGGMIASLM